MSRTSWRQTYRGNRETHQSPLPWWADPRGAFQKSLPSPPGRGAQPLLPQSSCSAARCPSCQGGNTGEGRISVVATGGAASSTGVVGAQANSRISILDRCLNPCVILDILGSFSRVTSIIYQQLDWASVPHLVNMPSAKTMACSWRMKVYCPTFPATVMHWQHYFIQLVLYYDVPVKKTLNYALFSLWTIRHCLVWLLIAWSWRKVFNI